MVNQMGQCKISIPIITLVINRYMVKHFNYSMLSPMNSYLNYNYYLVNKLVVNMGLNNLVNINFLGNFINS